MDNALRSALRDFIKEDYANSVARKLLRGYSLRDFKIHPFNLIALSSGFFQQTTPETMARALIYPRVLGTSITTIFGGTMQRMCVRFLDVEASAVPGMDFHFHDKKDGRHVYMQLKSGPNTLNSKDVTPMLEEMRGAYRLLRTNMAGQNMPLFAVGVCYGKAQQLSSHYRAIANSAVHGQLQVPIYIGKDLWERITGDASFYSELIGVFVEVFESEDYSASLEACITSLAQEIEETYFDNGELDPDKL